MKKEIGFYTELLKRPEASAKVKTRWWWYGCRVSEADICYQLDEMAEAGIGGVEIQITYPLEPGDDNIEYFSPAFFRILKFTSEEVRKRGMTFDLTLGSSWPFGGPFIPFVKSAVTVIPLELTVEGPMYFSYDFTNRAAGEIIGCVMGKMEGSRMLPETIRDLRGHLTDKLLYNWPWGTKLEDVEIPEGVWKIAVFIASQFREHVLMPTRGAEGYVVDHNNREAVRFFLEHAGTPVVNELGRGAVDNFFCDSLEVFGHNWTIDLYPEFKKRRGYALEPYIYALWGEVKGLTDLIRYDFHKTLSELTIEGFFREMTDWCHEVGSKSRIQAHGTWGDVLLAYAAADIPEGETFSAWDKFSVNTVHRRLASSAGHLYHRNIISNESFTWLRFPRFTETLEQIKIAADSIFTDGINQIVNHGYSYSPKDGEPLYFYASSTISHTNTWWPYYHYIADYIQRVCTFLQRGTPVAKVALYLPQSDIWAENPLSDVHMCMKLEEKIETAAVDLLAHHGYWFDYINDEAMMRWREYAYDTLIIMETERMPEETVKAIRSFALDGGLVICAGRMPSKDCGKEGNYDVAGAFARMQEDGMVCLTEDKWDSLIRVLGGRRRPDLRVTEGMGDIGYVHRADEDTDIYFTANMSLHTYDTELIISEAMSCAAGCGSPVRAVFLDPMSGEESFTWEGKARGGELTIPVRFLPGQSFLMILTPGEEAVRDDGDSSRTKQFYVSEEIQPVEDISDGWILEVPSLGLYRKLGQLEGFEKIPELKYYSGEVIYRRVFRFSPENHAGERVLLQAEQVACAASVTLNGCFAADWIMHPYIADLTGVLREGENELCIRVSNLLINRFLDPAAAILPYPDEIMDVWPYFPQPLNKERAKRLDGWRERDMIKEPVPSGLIGRIWLNVQKNE